MEANPAFREWVLSGAHFDFVPKETSQSISEQPGIVQAEEEFEESGVVPGFDESTPQSTGPANSSRSGSTSLPPGIVSRSSRNPSFHQSASARQQPPLQASNRQPSFAAQRGLDVLITHYLNMLPGPVPATYEEPKGASKLLLKLLCPPASLAAILVPLFRLLTLLSHLVIALSMVLVPAWLWLLKQLSKQGPEPVQQCAAGAVAGLVVLLLADTLHRADLQRKWRQSVGIIKPSQLGELARPPAAPLAPAASLPPRLPPTHPAQPQPPLAPAAPGPSGSSQTAPGPQSGPGSAGAVPRSHKPGGGAGAVHSSPSQRHKADEALARSVRQAVMRLELSVYGNELTEGLLPAGVLPQRVRKLCEEVGLEWSEGDAGRLEYLLERLKAAERVLGV